MLPRFLIAGCLILAAALSVMAAEENYTLNVPSKIDTNFAKGQTPTLHLSFSMERKANNELAELGQGSVKASVLNPDSSGKWQLGADLPGISLKRSGSKGQGAAALFMLDISGSMLALDSGDDLEYNKLVVVKDAMEELFKDQHVRAPEIATFFDRGMEKVLSKGDSLEEVRNALLQVEVNRANLHTALYESMRWAIGEAKSNEIRHIVFLTDGQDETFTDDGPFESLRFNASEDPKNHYREWQRQREEEIRNAAIEAGNIHIHTIGFGNPDPGMLFQQSYTDCGTLQHIAEGTTAEHKCIDITGLRGDGIGSETYRKKLRDQWTTFLNRLNEIFHYDYDLEIPIGLENLHKGTNKIGLDFHVNGETVSREIEVLWDGSGFGEPRLHPIFIEPPSAEVSVIPITLEISGILGALTLVPVFGNKISRLRQQRQKRTAVQKLPPESPLIGQGCPQERRAWGPEYLFKSGDWIVVCPNLKCKTVHHLDCWVEGGHQCWIPSCRTPLRIEPDLLAKIGIRNS